MSDEKEVTISISGMPEDLLKDIDAIAKADDRSRSYFIVKTLKEATAGKRPPQKRKDDGHSAKAA